ncbi:MAG: amidohydrolase family protein, partial [Brevibacterium yomogidense]
MTDSTQRSASEPTIIYPARLVRTMDPTCPTAEAVAVRGDRFRAVGTVEELLTYPRAVVDDRYADAVLLPGFVEAHSHAGTGNVWKGTYIGFVDRTDPDGVHWPGCRSVDEVVSRLQAEEKKFEDPDQTMIAWGLDPIFFDGQPLTAPDLDRVSTTRPIYINQASGHACTVNTAAIRRCGVDESTGVDGVALDADGRPNGELHEFVAMGLVQELAKN